MSTESSSSAPIEKRSVSAEPADFIELINAPSTEPSNTETGNMNTNRSKSMVDLFGGKSEADQQIDIVNNNQTHGSFHKTPLCFETPNTVVNSQIWKGFQRNGSDQQIHYGHKGSFSRPKTDGTNILTLNQKSSFSFNQPKQPSTIHSKQPFKFAFGPFNGNPDPLNVSNLPRFDSSTTSSTKIPGPAMPFDASRTSVNPIFGTAEFSGFGRASSKVSGPPITAPKFTYNPITVEKTGVSEHSGGSSASATTANDSIETPIISSENVKEDEMNDNGVNASASAHDNASSQNTQAPNTTHAIISLSKMEIRLPLNSQFSPNTNTGSNDGFERFMREIYTTFERFSSANDQK